MMDREKIQLLVKFKVWLCGVKVLKMCNFFEPKSGFMAAKKVI